MNEVLDDAFRLAREAQGVAGHTAAKKKLREMHRGVAEAEWELAYKKAFALLEACYGYAERCRLGQWRDDKALRAMEGDFPGFSTETYSLALSHGYFLSR